MTRELIDTIHALMHEHDAAWCVPVYAGDDRYAVTLGDHDDKAVVSAVINDLGHTDHITVWPTRLESL